MKKLILLPVLALFIAQYLSAQSFLGIQSTNWGGVTNVSFNPAIADSHFQVDINLIGVGFGVANNYLGISRSVAFHPSTFNSDSIQANFKERVNGNQKNIYTGLKVQGPLSFMFSFGKYNKNAIAFTYNLNEVTSIVGIGEQLARLAYYNFTGPSTPYLYNQFSNQNLRVNMMAWYDYGLTYSRVIYDKGPHMFKAGVTLKLTQGIEAAYLYSNNLQYKFNSKDTLNIYNSDVSYGITQNANYSNSTSVSAKEFMPFVNGSKDFGMAGDFGLVYEWRPNKEKYRYSMDGRDDNYRRDKDLYVIQAGFSMVDIGAVNFSRLASTQNFSANIQNWYVGSFSIDNGVQSLTDTINSHFKATSNTGLLKMWLPTRTNLWIDAQIYKGIGVNGSASITTIVAKSRNQVQEVSTYAVTPHYDNAWFGAYIPFSMSGYDNFNMGLALRFGPVIIGTSTLLDLFAKKYIYEANVYAALKIPIPYKMPGDKDHDGVSNRKDKCPKDPGPWATRGCPDRDGDGIVDKDDRCPDAPGPKEFQGCPDSDGDGIPDIDDSCPHEKGLAQFHGCPDSDSDGIPDRLDRCPFAAGPAQFQGCPDSDGDGIPDIDDSCPHEKGLPQFHGCPDRDGDGIPDKDDKCPDAPGLAEHHGCPDTDGDGVFDDEDSCIHVPGPKENHGCPWPDTDGDGIPDKDDACPTVFGVAENHGCPKLEKKEIETIKYAFENLEFETGKDVIKSHSFPSLNSLADLLIKKANYGLRIDGYTDNVGSVDKNITLSQKRAEAVKKYLVKKGVDASKLDTHGYGESNPFADNKTAAGRQKNRRVEMNITFK